MMRTIYTGAALFDGNTLHPDMPLSVEGVSVSDGKDGRVIPLDGGYILPGLLDLQINGAAGQMVSGQTTVSDLAQICQTHARLGATGVLPTLITDTPDATASIIAAAMSAVSKGVPGLLGLHLEGPHLDPARKGAHDAALIRPMMDSDLNRLCDAAKRLPTLMMTVAPEAVNPAQITALVGAGAKVSLGHSDCGYQSAVEAIRAGATCVTHLFNAMSQLGNREPGLVGAALAQDVFAGLIADGIHVAPNVIRIAIAAKPEKIFLVSDCMAVAGSDLTEFALGGRRILRRDGRLTLTDGTLAGADLTLPKAIGNMVQMVGASLATAFAMATTRPAACINRHDLGHLMPGAQADFIHLSSDFQIKGVWQAGERIV